MPIFSLSQLCYKSLIKTIRQGERWDGEGGGRGIQDGEHVNPWLIHVNVWQNPLQYCKVISLQLIKINWKKKKTEKTGRAKYMCMFKKSKKCILIILTEFSFRELFWFAEKLRRKDREFIYSLSFYKQLPLLLTSCINMSYNWLINTDILLLI